MGTAGLIVAAGRGQRLGSDLPKQYLRIGRETVLRRSIRSLLACAALTEVRVVTGEGDAALYEAALDGLDDARLGPPIRGGATRTASVRAGLEALAGAPPDLVLIHDAARPFASASVVASVLDALASAPAALPALPVVDALWEGEDGFAVRPARREGRWRAQTPQGFRFAEILAAHRLHGADAADDAAVARAAGLQVRLVRGEEANFKITTAADLERARAQAGGEMDIRTGNGFDVHAFGPGSGVRLCGVDIPFERGLIGHSDADVGMHALTDAIFGALAEGDIGQWFPPSEPAWKGADSEIFLRRAVERSAERGFRVGHLDCTLVCEAPKIGPHATAMRRRLAEVAGIETDRVSVKATTSERLGFTGRGEGIAALATATLVRP